MFIFGRRFNIKLGIANEFTTFQTFSHYIRSVRHYIGNVRHYIRNVRHYIRNVRIFFRSST